MQDNPYILGFTAGELSPWLSSRFDLQAYQRGAALLQNFLVQPYGGLKRRNGSEFVALAAQQSGDAVRLVPFSFSEEDSLMLEFFPRGMRVYKEGRLLLNDAGDPYVLTTPWETDAVVKSLRFMQVNDVVYVTSPYLSPTTLKRYGNTNWTCSTMGLTPYPRETYLQQSSVLSVEMETNGFFVLLKTDGSAPPFTPEMVNKEYVLADREMVSRTLFLNEAFSFTSNPLPDLAASKIIQAERVYHSFNASSQMYNYFHVYNNYYNTYYNGSKRAECYPAFFSPGVMRFDASCDYRPYEICGDWSLHTYGEWNAAWELWRSYDTLSTSLNFYKWQWTCIHSFEQNAFSERKNWALSGSEEMPCRMVLVCRSASSASQGAYMSFRIGGGSREYKFLITRYDSEHQVRARLMSSFMDETATFSTRNWSFGAFGARNGYPIFSGLHQSRLWFGGAKGLPTTLFASTTNDFGNFRVNSNDDAALHLTLAADDQSRICWICPARSLLVGTTESEWTLSSSDGAAVTPSNSAFTRQSSVGSEVQEASGVENTVFYVQRGGRRLREISYKLEADGYTSTDTSLLAEHLFSSGVREWVVQRGSSARLWVLMNDLSIAVLTTNAEQQVTAWQRISFPGRLPLHLATLARLGSNEDELWLVLRNELSGVVTIERIVSDSVFIDGMATVSPETAQIGADARLAGLRGIVYPAGHPELAQEVEYSETGAFEIDNFSPESTYVYGIAYTSCLETMPQENERSYNRVRQEGRVKLRVLQSNPVFRYKASHVQRWESYEPGREGHSYPYTGDIRLSHIPAVGVGQGFCLSVDGAADFQLLSLTIEFDFHGH